MKAASFAHEVAFVVSRNAFSDIILTALYYFVLNDTIPKITKQIKYVQLILWCLLIVVSLHRLSSR